MCSNLPLFPCKCETARDLLIMNLVSRPLRYYAIQLVEIQTDKVAKLNKVKSNQADTSVFVLYS